MKIGTVGDFHMGAAYNMGKLDPETQLNTRLLDFANTFDRIIDTFVKHNVKVVVLTGDNFDTRHPTTTQLNAFSKCIQRAIDFGMEVIINAGNHDQQRHTSTTTVDIYKELKIPKLSVYSEMGLHRLKNNIHLLIMPYRDRKMIGAKTNSDAIAKLRAQVRELTSKIKGKKIVVGHYMLEKSPEDSNPDTFSINELILPLDMFDGCDAVIMGHIHKPEIVSKRNPVIIYSGSMEKVSYGEKDHKKITVIIDTDNIEKFKILNTKVRDLFVLELDYTDDTLKEKINEKIIEDLENLSKELSLKNSICKVIIKVNDGEIYYINQIEIKDFIVSKGVNLCTGIHINSISTRLLRNSSINETISEKKAIASFIDGLIEHDNIKGKLLKFAEKIIDEVKHK